MPPKTCEKGYCVKCKAKNSEMTNCVKSKTTNGRNMVKGKCKKCGTNMCKFIKG